MRGPCLLAACTFLLIASGASAQPTNAAPRDAESPRVQTTKEANSDGLGGVATAPLRDLNVLRTKIPPVLIDAMADPYKRPPSRRCADLVALLAPLNESLGADLDAPSRDEDDLLQKGRETALGAAAGMASDAIIPFRGWVRKLSGAERHDRLVQAAITAGAVRRGYLKGLGEARGCNPPATPSHARTEAQAAAAPKPPEAGLPPPADGLFKPRFPVRPGSNPRGEVSPAQPPAR